jgi:hypothetical protein
MEAVSASGTSTLCKVSVTASVLVWEKVRFSACKGNAMFFTSMQLPWRTLYSKAEVIKPQQYASFKKTSETLVNLYEITQCNISKAVILILAAWEPEISQLVYCLWSKLWI